MYLTYHDRLKHQCETLRLISDRSQAAKRFYVQAAAAAASSELRHDFQNLAQQHYHFHLQLAQEIIALDHQLDLMRLPGERAGDQLPPGELSQPEPMETTLLQRAIRLEKIQLKKLDRALQLTPQKSAAFLLLLQHRNKIRSTLRRLSQLHANHQPTSARLPDTLTTEDFNNWF